MQAVDLNGSETAAPMTLARAHASLAVGATVLVTAPASWDRGRLRDLIFGAGFSPSNDGDAVRLRSLPDTVGPGMRLLVCGLNPSLFAADAGVGFARPGNRFWPAALAAGLVRCDRDPFHALEHSRVGMTDLVKRATARSAAIAVEEYREGAARVERLAAWLAPAAICFVGLEGWRAAVDPRSAPGWQPDRFGGVPTYVMPSTSGLNARTSLAELTAHLAAAAGPPPSDLAR